MVREHDGLVSVEIEEEDDDVGKGLGFFLEWRNRKRSILILWGIFPNSWWASSRREFAREDEVGVLGFEFWSALFWYL